MEDLLGSSLHRQLHGLVPHPSHFVNSILLPIEDLLGLLDDTIRFSLEEVVDCVLCLDALGALHDACGDCLSELLLEVGLRFVWFSFL